MSNGDKKWISFIIAFGWVITGTVSVFEGRPVAGVIVYFVGAFIFFALGLFYSKKERKNK